MTRHLTRWSATAASLILATACGGTGGAGDQAGGADAKGTASAADGCAAADTTPVMGAVLEYIKTTQPSPLRFLNAAGTDSAVPDDGFRIMQDRGPTFFYAGSEAALAKLRDKLEMDGPWATLLIVYRGSTPQPDGTVQVKLGGQFVANQENGTRAPERTFTARCTEGQWRIDGATKESGRPKPPGADSAADSAKAGGE